MSSVLEPVRRDATYQDVLDAPEHLVAEIIDGELYTSPRPASPHTRAAGALFSRLYSAFDEGMEAPDGWWILNEPELHLGKDVLVPDIAGWRRERMPVLPSVAWFDLAPDWICEVVSPKTSRLDRIRKLPRYARNGIPYAWIVDPISRSLEVYKLSGELYSVYSTHEVNAVVRAEPFESIELNLAVLWMPEMPTPPSPQS